LTGLTDTSITTPADREVLRFDGSDWVNELGHDDAAFYVFPVYDASAENNTSNTVINADNQVKVFCWNFPHPINLDRIIWEVDTQTGAGCDWGAVSIWKINGTTKLADSGPVAYSTNDTVVTSDIVDVWIPPGTYYVAYTATETSSCTVLADEPPGGTNDGYEDLLTEMFVGGGLCAGSGTAANPSTNGNFPATLGVITNNTNVYRPIIVFEGTTQ
jgi:hypothetical protein